MPPSGLGARHAPAGPGEAPGAAAPIPRFLSSLWRRRRVFATVALLCPLIAWLGLRQATPLYTATGTLVYEASEYQARELQSMMRAETVTEATMATQA